MAQKLIALGLIEDFVQNIVVKAGIAQEDAKIITDVLVQSDVLGFDTHGVNRLKPIYLERIKEGIINRVSDFEIVKQGPATAVVDGKNSMGQVIAYKAMKLAIEKARIYGMGMVAVRNSNHYGFAGYYPLMAAAENMIGITGTNARPSVAPTFGVEGMLGTNPLTFAMPSDEPFPFMLDCATSLAQRGKIELYHRLGKDIPQGWIIDEEGNTKTNIAEVMHDLNMGHASLAPLGGPGEENAGYKGYGYATVVEILSSALQQGAFMKMLLGKENGKKVPYRVGHFFIAINIESFTEVEDFKKTTGDILRELRASKKMPGHNRIYTAGEKEYLTMLERRKNGLPVNEELLAEFRDLCHEYGLQEYLQYF